MAEYFTANITTSDSESTLLVEAFNAHRAVVIVTPCPVGFTSETASYGGVMGGSGSFGLPKNHQLWAAANTYASPVAVMVTVYP